MAVLIGAFEVGYIKGLRRSDKDTDLGLSYLSGAQGVSATSLAISRALGPGLFLFVGRPIMSLTYDFKSFSE